METENEAIRQTLATLKAFLAQESVPRLSESDTKANFIEPIIAALGWSGLGVVTREYYVRNSQEFIDYAMIDPSATPGRPHPILAIEAKALQSDLTEKNAAQLIQYCAVEGIEWAALTNGRELQFFNTFLKPDLSAKRVMKLDLLAFNSDEEFDALVEQLWQLSRQSLTTEVTRTWLNQLRLDTTVREMIFNPGSTTIRQLRKQLADAEVQATSQELVGWFRSHLQSAVVRIPRPLTPTQTAALPSAQPPARPATSIAPVVMQPALYQALREAIAERFGLVEWRSTKGYESARIGTRVLLWAKLGRQGMRIELPDPDQPARRVGLTTLHQVEDITEALLDEIAAGSQRVPQRSGNAYYGTTLPDLVNGGVLPSGTHLVFTSGNRDIIRAEITAKGEILWEGKIYRVPSDRVFAQLLGPGRTSVNGWTHWVAELPEGRVQLATLRGRLNSQHDARPEAMNR